MGNRGNPIGNIQHLHSMRLEIFATIAILIEYKNQKNPFMSIS